MTRRDRDRREPSFTAIGQGRPAVGLGFFVF
jgi:hypothetical protein